MPFRALTDKELREAAQEAMMAGDWWPMRDMVKKLFPNAVEFGYFYVSEYNDQGYDMRMRLDCVFGLFDGKTVQLVQDGDLTTAGEHAIKLSPGWTRFVEDNIRWGADPDSYLHEEVYEMDDADPMIYLPDGEEGEIIMADIVHGPKRKYSQLFVAVSE